MRHLLAANAQPEATFSPTGSARKVHPFVQTLMRATDRPSQPHLSVGAPGSAYEREADTVAERVLRMSEPQHERAGSRNGGCPACQGEEPGQAFQLVQARRVAGEDAGATAAPSIVHQVLRSPGRPLSPPARAFFEPRFGTGLASVRVHTGALAAESARAIDALAYTSGSHVVFDGGQYAPQTRQGQRLLAHELAHVLQQRDGAPVTTIRRRPAGEEGFFERKKKECLDRLAQLANEPGPQASYTKGGCPANFCRPFADKEKARADLDAVRSCILAGILVKLAGSEGLLGGTGAKVLPLWEAYLSGGSPPQDLSAKFGLDFTASPTTADVTDFLLGELRRDLEENHAAGLPLSQYSHMPRFTAAQAAINTPGHIREMNFDIPGDVAGNLAGGIGRDQRAFPIGAMPSPWDDLRAVDLRVNLQSNPDGSVTAIPTLTFVVQESIDLCPGNCGDADEQQATVPLSRFEATGLAGDVPFIIRFEAPPEKLAPFQVGARPPGSP
ncbi:MAG TPA: DUF4157 domain-containing protein [Anaerolineae bacterium]|nr:DUF4157 domain-containing protein [Anaerolineae bacterium]